MNYKTVILKFFVLLTLITVSIFLISFYEKYYPSSNKNNNSLYLKNISIFKVSIINKNSVKVCLINNNKNFSTDFYVNSIIIKNKVYNTSCYISYGGFIRTIISLKPSETKCYIISLPDSCKKVVLPYLKYKNCDISFVILYNNLNGQNGIIKYLITP